MFRTFFFALIVLSCSLHAEHSRLANALLFPGVPQLSDGKTARGLLYLTGEVVLLTASVTNLTKSYSYARETEYLWVQYTDFDSTTDQQKRTLEQWNGSLAKSQQMRSLAVAFGASAALWWAWSIADAFIFRPREDENEVSILKKASKNLTVAVDPQGVSLSYALLF